VIRHSVLLPPLRIPGRAFRGMCTGCAAGVEVVAEGGCTDRFFMLGFAKGVFGGICAFP